MQGTVRVEAWGIGRNALCIELDRLARLLPLRPGLLSVQTPDTLSPHGNHGFRHIRRIIWNIWNISCPRTRAPHSISQHARMQSALTTPPPVTRPPPVSSHRYAALLHRGTGRGRLMLVAQRSGGDSILRHPEINHSMQMHYAPSSVQHAPHAQHLYQPLRAWCTNSRFSTTRNCQNCSYGVIHDYQNLHR